MTTKKSITLITIFLLVLLLVMSFSVTAFAITESEVETQVDTVGRETVTGNVLIWFLCAIAFLKVSQKIDSFMASLGVNVGHTGGSMLAEALIATRTISTVVGSAGRSFGGGGRGSPGSGGSPGGTGSGWFLKGGLAGVINRKVTSDAVKSATSTTSAVKSTHSSATAAQSEKQSHTSTTSAQNNTHTTTSHTADRQSASASAFRGIGIGGAMFARSLLAGGSFANDVIGKVACGDVRSTGSISGDLATQSLLSYMGYTALGEGTKDVPEFRDVEIGGGRITGMEIASGSAEGIAFGMYNADQYTAPEGDYSKVHSADGTMWYKQYAQDAVVRKPYEAPDGTVAYHEHIVKKLPDPPKRKDRI